MLDDNAIPIGNDNDASKPDLDNELEGTATGESAQLSPSFPEEAASATPSAQNSAPASQAKTSGTNSSYAADSIPWPDPDTDLWPEADLVVVLKNDPLSPPLNVSKAQAGADGRYEWRITHPTKIEIRNLEEIIHKPEVVPDRIQERFSLFGVIVSFNFLPSVHRTDKSQHRVQSVWLDNFGIEGKFVITYADSSSAAAACLLGVVSLHI